MEKRKKNRRGASMVSVIVGFALLLLAVAMLHTAVTASMRLVTRARMREAQDARLAEAFYAGYRETAEKTERIALRPQSDDYEGFDLDGVLREQAVEDGGEADTVFYYYQYPGSSPEETEELPE